MRSSADRLVTLARGTTSLMAVLALALSALLPTLALAEGRSADDGRGGDHRRPYDHVFVIVEENTEYGGVIGNPELPTINQLASRYGLATQYFGTIHPSEGNYVSMVGGAPTPPSTTAS